MASEGNGCWWSCRSLSHLFEWNTGISAATGLGGVDGCVARCLLMDVLLGSFKRMAVGYG